MDLTKGLELKVRVCSEKKVDLSSDMQAGCVESTIVSVLRFCCEEAVEVRMFARIWLTKFSAMH